MKAGLTDEQIAVEMNVKPDRSARVRRTVLMTLADEPTASKTWASMRAALYRELLNYPISEGLRQHIDTRLTHYQGIDPTITTDPLGHITLGATPRPKPEKPQEPCNACNLVHNGECW
jgi:hypothetical protein